MHAQSNMTHSIMEKLLRIFGLGMDILKYSAQMLVVKLFMMLTLKAMEFLMMKSPTIT